MCHVGEEKATLAVRQLHSLVKIKIMHPPCYLCNEMGGTQLNERRFSKGPKLVTLDRMTHERMAPLSLVVRFSVFASVRCVCRVSLLSSKNKERLILSQVKDGYQQSKVCLQYVYFAIRR